METRVSTKGQVVLPGAIRRKLGIQPGDRLIATVVEDHILLSKRAEPARKGKIVYHPLTGLPAWDSWPDAPTLTHKQIKEMLADFP